MTAPAATESKSTSFLARSIAAAEARYAGREGFKPATAKQIGVLLNIAHRLPQDTPVRMVLFGFIKEGISLKGARRLLTIAGQRDLVPRGPDRTARVKQDGTTPSGIVPFVDLYQSEIGFQRWNNPYAKIGHINFAEQR